MKRLLILAAGFLIGAIVMGTLVRPTAAPTSSPQVESPDEQAAQRAGQPAARAAGALPDLTAVAERSLQASVNISSTSYVRLDPFQQFLYGGDVIAQPSLGSGVIISADGDILTNEHVVGNARAEIRVTLPDGREVPGTVVGVDEISDLAVIKVNERGLTPLPWGDSNQLRVAEWVLAVGNPFQLSGTVTLGIVSTVSRSGAQVGAVADFIQTDAAINPGNSGGALVNARGELVGINTRIYSETGGYQGIGFAIPSNLARRIMTAIVADGEVRWGSIGQIMWMTVTENMAERAGLGRLTGAQIRNRPPRDSAAARAGLQPYDIVTAFNGQTVTAAEQLQRLIITAPIGSTAKIEVLRNGRRGTVNVPIQSR